MYVAWLSYRFVLCLTVRWAHSASYLRIHTDHANTILFEELEVKFIIAQERENRQERDYNRILNRVVMPFMFPREDREEKSEGESKKEFAHV